MTTVSVLGNRPKVGLMTLLNGALHVALAIPLGALWGLSGVALATFLSALLTTIPFGCRWVSATAGITTSEYVRNIARWSLRAVPVLVLSWFAGRLTAHSGLFTLGLSGAVAAVCYAIACRPMLSGLPLPARVRQALTLARLL